MVIYPLLHDHRRPSPPAHHHSLDLDELFNAAVHTFSTYNILHGLRGHFEIRHFN